MREPGESPTPGELLTAYRTVEKAAMATTYDEPRGPDGDDTWGGLVEAKRQIAIFTSWRAGTEENLTYAKMYAEAWKQMLDL